MNILITGAGLVGCHFAAHVVARGHQAVLYDLAPNSGYVRSVAGDVPVARGDVRDLPALMETMQQHRVDSVFHTAGLIGPRVSERPYTGLAINVAGTISVAEAAHLAGVRRLLFASTLGVYDVKVPATEPIGETFPMGADGYYGASKVASEHLLRAYAAGYQFDYIALRFAAVYGRGHYVGGSTAGQVMHAVAAAAAAGGPVRVDRNRFGASEYVYVLDAVKAVTLACETSTRSKVFNISSGRLITAEDVAEAIRAVRPGLDVSVVEEPGTPGQLRAQPMDISRARQELGFEPEYNLTRGLEHYLKQLEQVA